MSTFTIVFPESDLASRKYAAILRVEIERASAEAVKVALDFSNVRSVSHSFADESFGVLADSHGVEWLLAVIRPIHARDEVLWAIAEAIDTRLTEAKKPIAQLRGCSALVDTRLLTA